MQSSRHVPPERPAGADSSAPGTAGGWTADDVLDPDALARLAELDPRGEGQFLRKLLMTFQSSAARLTGQLEAAIARGDAEGIRLVAHTLKSSAGYLGALDLVARCAALEAATKALPPVPLAAEIAAMNASLAVALAAVSRRLTVSR